MMEIVIVSCMLLCVFMLVNILWFLIGLFIIVGSDADADEILTEDESLIPGGDLYFLNSTVDSDNLPTPTRFIFSENEQKMSKKTFKNFVSKINYPS